MRGALSGARAPVLVTSADFDQADNASSIKNPEIGAAWVQVKGTWGTSSNRGYCSALGAGNTALCASDSGRVDSIVSCVVPVLAGSYDVALAARCTDVDNLYLFRAFATGTVLQIYKGVAAVFTQLAQVTFAISAGDTLGFAVQGTTLIGLVNGVQKVTITDGAITSGTKVGMWAQEITSRYDTFRAYAP